MRFATAASWAGRTFIPFASSAAAARFTVGSSAALPNRRLIEPSGVGWSSATMWGPSWSDVLASANTWRRRGLLHVQVLSDDVARLLRSRSACGGRWLAADDKARGGPR